MLRGRIQAEDGTLFDSVDPGLRACEMIYPGVRTECTMVFEMPLDKLPGATRDRPMRWIWWATSSQSLVDNYLPWSWSKEQVIEAGSAGQLGWGGRR